jgi:glycosyltransferase involved in cell wall biosynthesis
VRILFLTQYFPPEVGAAQTRLHETAVGLHDLGHDVTVLTGPPHYPDGRTRPGYSPWRVRREKLDGVRIVRLPVLVRPNRSLIERTIDQASFAMAAMAAWSVVARSEVVIVDSPPLFLGITAAFFRIVYRRPYLFHVADPWPDYPIEMGALRNPHVIRIARAIETLAYSGAALITTPTRPWVQRIAGHPSATAKVRLLVNGVDVSRFQPDRSPAEVRAELGWPEAMLTLVYVGSVGIAQGLDTLIEAAAPLGDAGVVVHVVGEGFDRDRLAREAADRGLDHIRFEAAVDRDGVPQILAAADGVLVMLRPEPINREALPTKLVEGLAAGRPLVVSADGHASDIVNDAQAGVTAPAGDAVALRRAILQLLESDERSAMGVRGRALAETTYARAQVVRTLSEYLDEVRSAATFHVRHSG